MSPKNQKFAFIKFNPWDKAVPFIISDESIKVNEWVVAPTEGGLDAGEVIELRPLTQEEEAEFSEIKSIDRFIIREDWNVIENHKRSKIEAINFCKKTAERNGLDMKIVDCHISFDDQRLIFAFIADGRVDFRAMVKELTRHFQKSIKLYQLGVRDEAKIYGDIGCCGQTQCCKSHLQKLGNVSSEMADLQQVAHRGSERLSGICGRLKCCLAYEKDLYEELAKDLPVVGTRVKTKHGRGEVIGRHVLKRSVDVKIDPEKEGEKSVIVEVPITSK